MFGRTLIIVGTLAHVYVFGRAASVPFLRGRAARMILVAAGVVLWLAFLLGRLVGHGGEGWLAMLLELLGMNWMAMLFLTLVPLLAIDLVTGFGLLLPRLAPSLRAAALIIGGVLSVIALVQGLRPPVIRDYEVRLHALPDEMDGTVLVAMSDLHLGSLLGEKWLEARLGQVQALQPDLVVLLGDVFEGHGGPQDRLLALMGSLSAPLGVWAVHGNHESYGRGRGGTSVFEQIGFQVLRNRWAEVRPGLVLAGVDYLSPRRGLERAGDLMSEALSGRPSGATVLLSHSPLATDRAAGAGADLMLCGHTHGGQVWPFGYLVRRVSPLLAGRYEVSGMTVIVCRGTGTWGPRMRLWAPSEILRVTLHPKENGDTTE